MKSTTLAGLLATGALASPIAQRDTNSTSGCFPYGNATFPSDGSAPSVPRDQWFCPASQGYGFQGFSYPLESDDCSDPSNGFDQMNADFAQVRSTASLQPSHH